jgi:hypothetical protein
MAMDKLQLSLIGVGSLGLVALYGFSKWQESRARKHAENVFGAEHRDVLLEDSGAERAEDTEARLEPGERIEPVADAPAPSRWEDADAPGVGTALGHGRAGVGRCRLTGAGGGSGDRAGGRGAGATA